MHPVIQCEVLLLLIVSALHLSFICIKHTSAINEIPAQTLPLSDPRLYYSSVRVFVFSVHDRQELDYRSLGRWIGGRECGPGRADRHSSGAHLHHYQLLNPSPSSSTHSDMFITEEQEGSAHLHRQRCMSLCV